MVRKTLRNAEFGRDALMSERPEGVGVAEATPRESIPTSAPAKKKPALRGLFISPRVVPRFQASIGLWSSEVRQAK